MVDNDFTKEQLIAEYSEKLMDGSAALFAGAGLSVPAGFVNWKELLRSTATDLGLTVDKEYDLIAVAQYYENRRGNRALLNERLILAFTKKAQPTENHRLIAQLPIHTVWTTNYDQLLEDAFKAQHKRVDVKRRNEAVSQWRPGTDVVVFKMHGDVDEPDKAVLTKRDYETYDTDHQLFTIRLKSDLVSFTFLFLGFSFTDPNIDYILSRVKNLTGNSPKQHYCILKRPTPPTTPELKADYEYECRKLKLRIEDLKRFAVQTLLIDDYAEVTEILSELNRRAFKTNVFVSGGAVIGTKAFDLDRLGRFARALGRRLIESERNIISGYGINVGPPLLVGAVGGANLSPTSIGERLILRPFPRAIEPDRREEVYHEWRESMVALAGFAVFLSGNRYREGSSTETEDSTGVVMEFDLAVAQGLRCCPIPVGATGFVAEALWKRVTADLPKYYGAVDVSREMAVLGDASKLNDELIDAIMSIIERA
jgi:hypothetical protein